MKHKVDTYLKQAKDLKVGDTILTNRMTAADIILVELFDDSKFIDVRLGGAMTPSLIFKTDDMVLVLEGGYEPEN